MSGNQGLNSMRTLLKDFNTMYKERLTAIESDEDREGDGNQSLRTYKVFSFDESLVY